jgi:hypothetical protein
MTSKANGQPSDATKKFYADLVARNKQFFAENNIKTMRDLDAHTLKARLDGKNGEGK